MKRERRNIMEEKEIENLRKVFLKAERELFLELMSKPKYRWMVTELGNQNAQFLANEAVKRIQRIESGEVKEEDLDKVEMEITLLLAALQEQARIKEREREKNDGDER